MSSDIHIFIIYLATLEWQVWRKKVEIEYIWQHHDIPLTTLKIILTIFRHCALNCVFILNLLNIATGAQHYGKMFFISWEGLVEKGRHEFCRVWDSGRNFSLWQCWQNREGPMRGESTCGNWRNRQSQNEGSCAMVQNSNRKSRHWPNLTI